MFTTDNRRRIRLAIVSPTPPRPCPVAAHTDELCRMLPVVAPRIGLTVFAIDHGDGPPHAAGRAAAGSIAADDPSAYRRAGQGLRRLGVDVALLEVGPGSAGGPHGRYLLGLTDELTRLGVPYLVAPHQVRPFPRPDDADMLSALCRDAAGVVVSSNSARRALAGSGIVPPRRVAVVPPGPAPELLRSSGAGRRPAVLARYGAGPVLTTTGYLSPTRGIEVVVAALPVIAAAHPDVRYVVAGRTLASPSGSADDAYRRAVLRSATALRVAHRLILLDTDLSVADTAALLRATDVYVAPDLDVGRTDDGPLADAVGMGLRVVASATPYAVEIAGDRAGAVVRPGDPAALAAAVEQVLTGPAPAPGRRSSAHAAEQIAGLVALVASPRSAPPRRTRATRRRTAA
jgi:glycosyltransferase involved in cell wall biosynthesis